MKLELSRQISQNTHISKFMKIRQWKPSSMGTDRLTRRS